MELYGYEFITYSDLAHHGIKGMHWGIRRFQNEDGSLTNAGRKRYGASEEATNKVKVAQEDYNKALKKYWNANYDELDGARKEFNAASRKLTWAKEDYRDDIIQNKISGQQKISKHREKLINQYKEKGMNDDEAAIAAYKRDRTEKILAATAAVALTAAAAYGATKYAENNFDRIIKTDVKLSRVATSDTKSVQDAFYAVFQKNKADVSKYSGFYANQIKQGVYGHKPGADVYEKVISAKQNLKMASPKSAMNALQDLMTNDQSYKKDVINILEQRKVQALFGRNLEASRRISKALTAARSGKMNRALYDTLNQALGSNAKNTDVAKKFYDTLSQRGYNAIVDMNDKKFSGFMTKTPVIVFNAKSKVSVDSVKNLSRSAIAAQNARAVRDIGMKTTVKALAGPMAGYVAGAGAVAGATKYVTSRQEQKIVSDYRKEHPDTKLSYKEIIRNYYRERN